MAKTVVISQNWGGITDDPRSNTKVSFDLLQHFDITNSVHVLAPQLSLEADDSGAKLIRKFEYANGTFYGFGTDDPGQTKLQVYSKSPILTGSWATATGGTSTTTGGFTGFPKHYKDYIYGIWSGSSVFQYGDITGTPSFTDAFGSISTTVSSAAEPFIHPSDDILYIPYANKLASVDVTTFTATVLTLPDNLTVVSLEALGEYLAIGCQGDGVSVNSKVFLWDRISADITQSIDFGVEKLYQIGNVDGSLVGISLSLNGATLKSSQFLVAREWFGGDKASVTQSKELEGSPIYTINEKRTIEQNNLYFLLEFGGDTVDLMGIWSYGRKNKNYPFRFNQEIKAVNDTPAENLQSFFKLGDYWWIAHETDGSIDRTNDNSAYASATSLARTEIFRGEGEVEIGYKKKLTRIGVIYKKFTGSESIVVKYKTDTDSSFTTIFTASTSGSTSEFATQLSGSNPLPSGWNEIQFELDDTGNAQILALVFEYELMNRI